MKDNHLNNSMNNPSLMIMMIQRQLQCWVEENNFILDRERILKGEVKSYKMLKTQ